MMSRYAKVLFYLVAGPLLKANGVRHRVRWKPPPGKLIKVHLGPGQKNYLPGWINVDSNIFTGKADIWADLRNTLPFPDESVDVIYSHHVIERLPDLPAHLREIYRSLKTGGVFRIGGPNGDGAIRKYLEREAGWFHDFPDSRESLGGRFENFIFCRGEHLTILTLSFLEELARNAGFPSVRSVLPVTETHYPDLIGPDVLGLEYEDTPQCPHTLMVEGQKPRTRIP